jgi:PAS domain S-box-containing protein
VTEALAVLRWAVGAALTLLAILTLVDWIRHRDRSRQYLAIAVGVLGVVSVLGQVKPADLTGRVVLTVVDLALFMTSALAVLFFRNSLIRFRPWVLWACTVFVLAVTGGAVAVNLDGSTAPPTGIPLAVDLLLLLSWCAVVVMCIAGLWRVSGSLPRVQRARLRALNLGFGGIVFALLIIAATAAGAPDPMVQVIIESIALASMPLLAVAFSPPGWLRRVWREREEVQLRRAINDLLLYSPNEAVLSARGLEWAARLLGGGAAMLALNGRVLAREGLDAEQSDRLHSELEAARHTVGVAFTSVLGPTAVVPLHSRAGEGYIAVVAGPFTPLFGDDELLRLAQYAVSMTVALDRVHLVVGVQRNAELLDLAYDAVFTWDFKTREIQYWNRAASTLYGFGHEEVLGRDPQPLLQTEYPLPRDDIAAALVRDGHWEGELRQRAKDGRVLEISARWALQRDSDGEPLSVLEINRDITAEKRSADELRGARDAAEQASTAKSEYLSRMSHELRTPLAAMLGFSDLLEMREPREDQVQAIEAIQRAGSHLLSLVNDVLDIARIEAGRESLSLEPVDVRAVLEECAGLVARAAADRSVQLSVRMDEEDELFVRADRQRLIQVMLNLLTNAIKYGNAGGQVVISAVAGPEAVDIAVSDDGPGMSEEQQARLFQPFERLGAERSYVQGTGLGLALSRQLSAAMGGTITVQSAEGAGATFTVRLTRASRTDTRSVIAATAPAVLHDAVNERTVLYVEDNLATVGLVESIFALRPNLRLITAMQGGMAVELAREQQPHLIILDLHLPDLNGDEVIHRLQRDPRTAEIPVMMYSADATERQVDRLLAEGAAAYLTKPARVTEFLEVLDRILDPPVQATGGR